jgi:hypothetical protein
MLRFSPRLILFLAATVLGAGMLAGTFLVSTPTTSGLATDVDIPGSTELATATPTATPAPTRTPAPSGSTQLPGGGVSGSNAAELPSAGSGGNIGDELTSLPRGLSVGLAVFAALILATLRLPRGRQRVAQRVSSSRRIR